MKNSRPRLMGILIREEGNCEFCGSKFTDIDVKQSTNVECDKCHKKVIICKDCKKNGCQCGGNYLDAWDKNPRLMH